MTQQDPRFLDDQLAYIRRMERQEFAQRHPEWLDLPEIVICARRAPAPYPDVNLSETLDGFRALA